MSNVENLQYQLFGRAKNPKKSDSKNSWFRSFLNNLKAPRLFMKETVKNWTFHTWLFDFSKF
jgi:hypothetical protein